MSVKKAEQPIALETTARLLGLTIRKLELQSFKCFDNLTVDFDCASTLPGRWTCVAGINGSGKTAVLQAICICMLGTRSQEIGVETLLGSRQRIDGMIVRPAKIALTLTAGEGQQLGARRVEIADGGEQSVKLGPRPKVLFRAKASPLVVGYGANRTLSDRVDSHHSGMSIRTRRIISLFDPQASLAQADVLVADRPLKKPLAKLLTRILSAVFEGQVAVEWVGESRRFRFRISGADIAAIDLPDGFRSSSAWLADLCAQWIDWNRAVLGKEEVSDDPAEIRGIVLIDEIDLHLHPSMQRSLVPALRKALPNVQWIVTTHSPLVLGCFDKNEIVALDRSTEAGVRVLDRQIFGFSTDEIYEWLMGTDASGRTMSQLAPGRSSARHGAELAQTLFASPTVGGKEANRRFQEMQQRLARLK